MGAWGTQPTFGSGAWVNPALERLTSWNLICIRIIEVQRSMSTRMVALPFCPDATVLPLAKFNALPTRYYQAIDKVEEKTQRSRQSNVVLCSVFRRRIGVSWRLAFSTDR